MVSFSWYNFRPCRRRVKHLSTQSEECFTFSRAPEFDKQKKTVFSESVKKRFATNFLPRHAVIILDHEKGSAAFSLN